MKRSFLVFLAMIGFLASTVANGQYDCSNSVDVSTWRYGDFDQSCDTGPISRRYGLCDVGRLGGSYGAESETELAHLCRDQQSWCHEAYRAILNVISSKPDSAALKREADQQLEQCRRHYSLECEDAAARICRAADRAAQSRQDARYVDMVARAQTLLSQLGYDPGPIDGIFGDLTQDALDAFLRKHPTKDGFRPLGHVDRQVLALLEGVAARQAKGREPTTALAQRCSELPGPNLGPNHTQCWQEFENRPGCHIWNNHYHGDRTIRWSGECHAGTAEGHGTLSMSSGSEHESLEATGTYGGGKSHGHWTVRHANGGVDEGSYVDNKRSGRWTVRYANGGVDEGSYVDNKRSGRWTVRYANGGVGEGSYVDDKPSGRWTHRYADGRVHEGSYVDDKRSGRWTLRYADGRVHEGSYVDGKRSGRWTHRYADGRVHEGSYVDGKQSGRWTIR